MQRRRFLKLTPPAVGSLAVAGCLDGDSCEGENTIEDIAADPLSYASDDQFQTIFGVVGEVTDVNRDRVIISDGTGTTAVTSGPLNDWVVGSFEMGECMSASGDYDEGLQDLYNVDLVLYDGFLSEE